MSNPNDTPNSPPVSPLMGEGGKPKRTQGVKIILFTVAVFVLVIFAVFNAILIDPWAKQEEQIAANTGRSTISDSGRLQADLIAEAAKTEPARPVSPPASLPAVISVDTPVVSGGQVIVIQPPRSAVRSRPRELSQEERDAARKYSEMRESSLLSPSTVSGFAELDNDSNGGNSASTASLSPSEQLMQMYMAMEAGKSGAQNVQNTQNTQQGGAAFEPFPVQKSKLAFLTQEGGDRTPQDYSSNTRQPQLAPMELKAGTVIPGIMLVGVNTDLPGAIIGQVSENVYDSATGQYMLIPQGTRILGTYDSRITFGQSRVGIIWNRLIYPDGSSLNIAGSPGADMAGYSGMKGRVNNHYGHILTAALFTSIFAAGAEIISPSDKDNNDESKSPADVLAESVGLTIADLGARLAGRALDIQPTITLKPGTRFNVLVMQDVVFTSAWNPQKTQRTRVASF